MMEKFIFEVKITADQKGCVIMDRKCSMCEWFELEHEDDDGSGFGFGFCRRLPPSFNFRAIKTLDPEAAECAYVDPSFWCLGWWPQVTLGPDKKNDWCGEFKPKIDGCSKNQMRSKYGKIYF